MTIEELENRHAKISDSTFLAEIKHTTISIEFAISILEDSITDTSYHEVDSFCRNKIEELKQQLKK